MQGSPFRVLIALLTALALTLGSIAGASAGGVPPEDLLPFCEDELVDGALVEDVEDAFLEEFDATASIETIIFLCEEAIFEGEVTVVGDVLVVVLPGGGGGGSVTIGGNGNSNEQDNDQDQTQEQDQGQTVDQDNANGSDHDNASAGSAGGDVDNGCDASQGEDDAGDDSVTCASGDATSGDSSVGDTNQANSGIQSGANDTDQSGTQTGGNQANAPSNTTSQTVDADVSDIGGDDNDTEDSSINDNSGDIDQSTDEDVIEGDDNEIGGGEGLSALLTQLIALLVALFADEEEPAVVTFSVGEPDGRNFCSVDVTLTGGPADSTLRVFADINGSQQLFAAFTDGQGNASGPVFTVVSGDTVSSVEVRLLSNLDLIAVSDQPSQTCGGTT